ncbi:MAG: hypothetical protein ACK5XA_15795 [Tagaea sp.]
MARYRTSKAKEAQAQLEQLKSWRDQELARQASNRYQMALDEDFYDGMQWTVEDARELLARGQSPVVYNETKPTIDWLIGTERRTRIDHKVVPTQRGEPALKDAINKTKLLKYLTEVNRTVYNRSRSFEDQVKAGVGWIETGISDDAEDEPIFDRHESWRNVLYDSLGEDRDINRDSRYLFRMKWVDVDVAQAYFPEKRDEIERAAESNPGNRGFEWWFGRRLSELDPDEGSGVVQSRWQHYDAAAWLYNPRDRIQIYECWWRKPVAEDVMIGPGVKSRRVRMQMHATLFTDGDTLWDGPSPYRHNKFPLIPMWCFRRARDGAPYGVVRNIRGPQESLNKRMSKSLFVMSSNQLIIESTAIDPSVMDEDEIRQEAAAPDGMIVLADGGTEKFKLERQNDVAQGHLALADRDKVAIREGSGVSSESLARDTNVTSGVAMKRKHEQGSLLNLQIFDNLRMARQIEGEIKLALIEQFYTEEKVFRLTGERNIQDWVEINTVDEVTGLRLNDVTAFKAKFIVDEQDFREDIQRAMFESLMELLNQIATVNPQFAMNVMDLVIEYSDVPGRETIVKRIRELTGQTDPNEMPDPAVEMKKQKDAALQDKAKELELRQLEVKVAEVEARIQKTGAEKLLRMTEAMFSALQAAGIVAQVPGTTPIADEILRSSGFQDQGGQDPDIPAPAAPMAMPALPNDTQPNAGPQAGIQTPSLTDGPPPQ